MNATYRINTSYAINQAIKAVRSWEEALEAQKLARDLEGIAFCEASLKASRANLAKVREDVKNVHQWL